MFRSFVTIAAVGVSACSHFTMDNEYVITARTEDLPDTPKFTLFTKPRGSKGLRASKYGYIAFEDTNIRSGMNDAGLQCDKQTLEEATHPPPSKTLDNIDAANICQWALEGFGSVKDLKLGLAVVNFVKSKDEKFAYGHWAFRDASGEGVVLEFLNHTMHVFDDNNDDGRTGYGIMTNDPPFPEHLKDVAKLKRRTNPEVPGSWNSVDRFNRIFLMKANMPMPSDRKTAIMQAIHVLNSVTVAGGRSGSEFLGGSKTQWAAVWDQTNRTLYWRSQSNQNMQRLRFADVDLREGGIAKQIDPSNPQLPWFSDASSFFQPKYAAPEVLIT